MIMPNIETSPTPHKVILFSCRHCLHIRSSRGLEATVKLADFRSVDGKLSSTVPVMKFPASSKTISLIFLFALFLTDSRFVLSTCHFPAIFNLGDSNSDTGGYAASLYPPGPPFGQTFFHMPAGRFSDGRLIIDFIAESFGLPFLSAYLDALGANFSHGANFATASASIMLPRTVIPNGDLSPFYLDLQLTQLQQVKSRSALIKARGGALAGLVPKQDYFAKALYTFDLGQNDLGDLILATNMTVKEIKASVPDIIERFVVNVKNVHNLGGRSFWIHNTSPIGCLTYVLFNLQSLEKDSAGCVKSSNDIAKHFNSKLKDAVSQLREQFPSASFTYVDIYSVKYSLFAHPQRYGFEDPLVTCCGYGGPYNFNRNVRCGGTIVVNGTEIFVGSCDRPAVRVIWDGVHLTEAANKFVFDQISTGKFSDPPVPLSKACRRRRGSMKY